MHWLLLASLVLSAHTHPLRHLTSNQQNEGFSLTTVLLFIVAGLLVVFLYHDRRNGHVYTQAIRGYIGDLIVRYKYKKRQLSEKVDNQEPPQTPKNIHAFDHQKTYLDASPKRKKYDTEDTVKEEVQLPQQVKSDTPEADFKNVFEIKESKSKHKVNKKSKSKLKGRLLGKGSDDGDELERSGEVEGSKLMEETEVSKDNAEQEDKGVQVLQ